MARYIIEQLRFNKTINKKLNGSVFPSLYWLGPNVICYLSKPVDMFLKREPFLGNMLYVVYKCQSKVVLKIVNGREVTLYVSIDKLYGATYLDYSYIYTRDFHILLILYRYCFIVCNTH